MAQATDEERAPQRVVAIRPGDAVDAKRNFHYFEGISERTAGSRQLAMQRLVIPPGARAEPHSHNGYETAIYVVSGRVQTFFGPGLTESILSEAGDYVFLPPEIPHQPVNLSSTEVAIAIIARSNPAEVEPVTPYVVSGEG
jgi:uncharacterized RmlC-like cupin family protein